jgi:hypothetical protein
MRRAAVSFAALGGGETKSRRQFRRMPPEAAILCIAALWRHHAGISSASGRDLVAA